MQAALASHDIKCEVVEEYSDDVEEGKVIRTDPEAGAELEKGATLTVYISKGKQKDDNENVSVPGLLGMTKDQAEKALTEKGLSIGSVNEVESTLRPVRSYGSRRMRARRSQRHCRQHPDLQGQDADARGSGQAGR